MLPGIDGVEFVRRVRCREREGRVPILMISGHGRLVSDSAKAAGCDAFLDKPFTLAQLRATMVALLGPKARVA
jgi:CheY-like chemotaxis protein